MASSRRPPSRPRPTPARPSRPGGQSGQPGRVTRSTSRPSSSSKPGSGRGGSQAATWTTPGAGPLRARIEQSSRAALLRVDAAPRWLIFLGFLGLAVGAALAPGLWGAACALVLAGFLGWLLYLAWPGLAPAPKAVRVLVISILIGAMVIKLGQL